MKALKALPPLAWFFQHVLGLDISTRAGVLTFLMSVNGELLDDAQAALFTRYTHRPYIHRSEGYRQAVLQAARQVGKSEGCAAHAVYTSVGAVLAGKRDTVVVAVAQDHRSGMRALFGHIKRDCDRPLIRPLVRRVTTDTIELEGGNSLIVLPCRPQAIRGLSCIEVLLDEVAHFQSTDNIPRDRAMWRAAMPTLAATGGRLIEMSSPHHASGLLLDQNKAHYGVADSDLLYWVGGHDMNPTLNASFLQHQRDMDPESARAELDAEFLQNVAALFDVAALDACVDSGVTERPPQPSIAYYAFCDAASGTGKDSFAAAIAHVDRSGVAVLDAVLVIEPEFSPESAVRQVAELVKRYRRTEIHGDRYAPGFVTEAFARHRITYKPSDRDKSAIALDLLPRVNSGGVRLLDHPDLLRELRGWERHRAATKDRIDHRRGAHDDIATAAAGALTLASGVRALPMQMLQLNGNVFHGPLPAFDPFEALPGEIRHDPSWRHFADRHGIDATLARWHSMRSGTYQASQPATDVMSTRVAGGGE